MTLRIISILFIISGIRALMTGHDGRHNTPQLYGMEAYISGGLFLLVGIIALAISFKKK
jgi:hypothetical protein